MKCVRVNWLWPSLGLVALVGCNSSWDGFWLVLFDDAEDISGDCVERDTGHYWGDTGDGDRYYENTTGDEWSVVEIKVSKGKATVLIPDYRSILSAFSEEMAMFHGDATKDQIKASYKYTSKEGITQSANSSYYWEQKWGENHQILINREGSQVEGEIRYSREVNNIDGYESGNGYSEDGYEWDCTTQVKFEGSRGNDEDEDE